MLFRSLAWRNARLVIDGNRISVSGAFRTVEIDLGEVSKARWRTASGSLKLASNDARCTITFREFEMPSSVPIVEYFRQQIPASVQTGWPWFEHKHVRRAVNAGLPGEGRALFDRRRFDRIVVPGAAVIVILGVAASWLKQDPRGMLVGIYAAFLVAFRYFIPRKGHYTQTIGAACREQPEMKGILALLPFALAGSVVCRLTRPAVPDAIGWLAGALMIAMGALIVSGILRERRQRRNIEEAWPPDDFRQSPPAVEIDSD